MTSTFTRATAALLCGLSLTALAQETPQPTDNQLTSQEQQDGWQLLFDGQQISQWRNYQQSGLNPQWQVKDGAMVLTGKGGGDILTKASYTQFELQLAWKIAEGGNSGIFILADEKGQHIYSHAPEIQILDNERHADNKLASHRSGSLYDMIAAPAHAQKPAGQWNQVKIRLQQQQLTVWQNQVKTADIRIHSPEWQQLLANSKFATWAGFAKASSGHIGLQDHGDQVWFKNIKIRELKP